MASDIGPDVVTFAALCLGLNALATDLGIEKAQRTIGFAPSREAK
jgi:hypothetical protein